MNIEQASKGFIVEADPPKFRGRPVLDLGSEQLRHWISSAGVMMSARMEEEGSGNTGSPVDGDAHIELAACEGEAGSVG